MSWRDPPIQVEDSETRELRRQRERAEQEARIRAEQLASHAERKEKTKLDQEVWSVTDQLQRQKMQQEAALTETFVNQVKDLTTEELERIKAQHAAEEAEFKARQASHAKELEAMTAAALAEMERQRQEAEARVREEQRFVLAQQATNPLGILYSSDGSFHAPSAPPAFVPPPAAVAVAARATPPPAAGGKSPRGKQKTAMQPTPTPEPRWDAPPATDAPPAYTAEQQAGLQMIRSRSAMHSEKELFAPQLQLVDPSFWPAPTDVPRGERHARCASCFDPIKPDVENGFSGRACRHNATIVHAECYFKRIAPHCKHCGFPLYPNEERQFSGRWGVYNRESYHAECYQKFAGPRCSSCFDIIFADPTRSFTGNWHRNGDGSLIHAECAAEQRAKLVRTGVLLDVEK